MTKESDPVSLASSLEKKSSNHSPLGSTAAKIITRSVQGAYGVTWSIYSYKMTAPEACSKILIDAVASLVSS